jgi:hypothetical protein
MTQNEIKNIEEKICKDGSLSEERKTELLNLLTTMKPEMRNYTNIKQNTQSAIQFSEQPANETRRRKIKIFKVKN